LKKSPSLYKSKGYPIFFPWSSVGGAERGRKFGGHTVPVAAASQIVISWWQTALKSGVGIPHINFKKVSPGPEIKLIGGPGPPVKSVPHRWNGHFKNRDF
jgi:hypothetical protein